MKRWRRTATAVPIISLPPPGAPRILSVQVGGGGAFWLVNFDQAVDCSESDASTFHTSDAGALTGAGNFTPTQWEVDSDIACVPGIEWTYDPADPNLSPTPAAPQTGFTIA